MTAPRRATLYAIPGSHAVRAGELMLEHKRIPFRRVNFPPGPHRVLVRMAGFRGDRVPAVRFEDGTRAQGTRQLPRVLDAMVPERRLVPGDPAGLEAEAWADEVLQQWARRMVAASGARDPDSLAGRGAEGRLGVLMTGHDLPRRMIARAILVVFRASKAQQRDDLTRTGAVLDRVDEWVDEGVLNGEELRSPDFAVASSLALLEYILELRPELERRPSFALLERVFSRSAEARDRA